jgi:hypothetical protein
MRSVMRGRLAGCRDGLRQADVQAAGPGCRVAPGDICCLQDGDLGWKGSCAWIKWGQSRLGREAEERLPVIFKMGELILEMFLWSI